MCIETPTCFCITIILIVPVSDASAEQSFSTLKIIKNYLQPTMWLPSLSILPQSWLSYMIDAFSTSKRQETSFIGEFLYVLNFSINCLHVFILCVFYIFTVTCYIHKLHMLIWLLSFVYHLPPMLFYGTSKNISPRVSQILELPLTVPIKKYSNHGNLISVFYIKRYKF